MGDRERFLSFQDFPWFRYATIGQLTNVEPPSPHHLYWPELDIDLAVESLDHPDRYPLVSLAQPDKRLDPRAAVREEGAKYRASKRRRRSAALRKSATARYYRDAAGRVRVEQIDRGVGALDATTGRITFITIDQEPRGRVYTLDPKRRISRLQDPVILGRMFNGGSSFAVPIGASQFRFQVYLAPRNHGITESLGRRMIEGAETIGRRVTTVVSAGHHDNAIPAEIVDERWVSPDLRLVIYARTSDPVTGVFEYWLTNITRREPSPDLFVVPPDYTFDHCSLPEDPCFASEWLPQAK